MPSNRSRRAEALRRQKQQRRRLAIISIAATVALVAVGVFVYLRSGPSTDLRDVTLSSVEPGTKPTVGFDAPFVTDKSNRRVLKEGSGEELATGTKVTVDYLGINGKDGKEFDTSFGAKPVTVRLDGEQLIPGLVEGLVGLKVGARALLSIAPKDGYGPQGGIAAQGIAKDDSLLFVVDVREIRRPLPEATGAVVAPVPGLPTVQVDEATRKTSITVPGGDPPTELVAQALIVGTGPLTASGQTITVHYTGVKWANGEQFDSSWTSPSGATDVALGAGRVIPAWDEALVGRTVGSRVLLVVPPDKGYGAEGNSQAGIAPTDTLVFAVDILDAF